MEIRVYIVVTLMSAILAGVLLTLALDVRLPYVSDGAVFVDVARNLIAGNGLVHTPFGLEPFDKETVPLGWFAPGYPLAIASLSMLGISPEAAALGISVVAWILLAPALVFCLRPLLTSSQSATIALLVCSSPGMFSLGSRIYADSLFFLLTVISLGVLFRAVQNRFSADLLLLSGLLASLAYAVRFSGIALLLVIPVALIAAPMLRIMRTRQAMGALALWAIAALPLYLTTVALAPDKPHEWVIKGPGLIDSIRSFLWNLLLDMTGSETVAYSAWDYRVVLFGMVPLAIFVALGLFKTWLHHLSPSNRFALLTLLLYLSAGAAMVILAIYAWGVLGKLRYVTNQSWIVFTLMVLAASSIAPRAAKYKILTSLAAGTLIILLIAGRMSFFKEVFSEADVPRMGLRSDTELLHDVRRLPEHAFIVSTLGSFLTYETGRSVRNLPRENLETMHLALSRAADNVPEEMPLYAVILPTTKMIRNTPETWKEVFLDQLPSRYFLEKRTENMLLLRRTSSAAQ